MAFARAFQLVQWRLNGEWLKKLDWFLKCMSLETRSDFLPDKSAALSSAGSFILQ